MRHSAAALPRVLFIFVKARSECHLYMSELFDLVLHHTGVMLLGRRLYTTHIMSATDFSHLRSGTRVLVFNAHLFGTSQV